MRRLTALGSLGAVTLLTSGCVDASFTAAEYPLDQPEPARADQVVPAQGDLVSRWQLPPSSPWAPYQKTTLLSVVAGAPQTVALPQFEDLEEVHLAENAAYEVAEAGMPAAMWIVDLRGAASVAFGSVLSQYLGDQVALVPTFNNWPSEGEVVPAEETLAAMIGRAPPRASSDPTAQPVFLLDSWRLAYKDEAIPDDAVDNRYMLSPSDFPRADELLAHGIRSVVYVVADAAEAEHEEDDLNALMLDYQAAGITLYMVDVLHLAHHPDHGASPWYVHVWGSPFYCRWRQTVVYDPRFYRRAHGGFGGVHVVPVPSGHVFGAFGGHGGG